MPLAAGSRLGTLSDRTTIGDTTSITVKSGTGTASVHAWNATARTLTPEP